VFAPSPFLYLTIHHGFIARSAGVALFFVLAGDSRPRRSHPVQVESLKFLSAITVDTTVGELL